MDGLSPKDLLDKASSAADLGVVLISGSAAFALDEITDFSPMPSGPTALVLMGVVLGLKKIGDTLIEQRRERLRVLATPREMEERAERARLAYVNSGRFDLAEKLKADIDLYRQHILVASDLDTSTDETLEHFRAEAEANNAAREEWRQVQIAAEDAEERLRRYGGSARFLEALREGRIGIDEVRDVLRPWLE